MTTALHQELGFEVYPQDLEGFYIWDEAVKVVEALGDGWRLPTKKELELMYLEQEEIGGFGAYYYWSSSEYDEEIAWLKCFYTGGHGNAYKSIYNRVRPVRNLKPLKEPIDKVVSDKPSTWREEVEDYEANKKLYDRIADIELQLECCKDASNGKDLLIMALEKRIVDLEYQAFQYAIKNERSPKAYVEKCDDGSFNVCFGVFQRKYVPIKTRRKNEFRRNF